MSISKSWLEMSEIYRKFCPPEFEGDFSEAAALEMFEHESKGVGRPSPRNGFAQGKKWMDVTVAMWRKDIMIGLLRKFELYEDYPRQWVDRVLAGVLFDPSAAAHEFR